MERNRAQKWLPLRFSIRMLLLIFIGLSCLLTYRLQPIHQARRFVADVLPSNGELAVAMIAPPIRDGLQTALYWSPGYLLDAQIIESPSQILVKEECHVKVLIEVPETSSAYEIVVNFANQRQPRATLTQGHKAVHSWIIAHR